MLPHTHLNIKTFSDTIFVIYHIITIIMKFRLFSTVEVYTTFQDLYVIVNFYRLKKSYAITIK